MSEAGSYEQLGIQINVEMGANEATSFLNKLENSLSELSKILQNIDLSKLEAGANNSAAGFERAAQAAEKLAGQQKATKGAVDTQSKSADSKGTTQEPEDDSFWGNFTKGIADALKKTGDFKSDTKAMGTSIFNTLSTGLPKALNTFMHPDTQKIDALKLEMATTQQKKTQLQQEISNLSSFTNKTPQEIAALNQKQAALAKINSTLKQQQDQMGQMTNAWARFAASLKPIMQSILQELQKYITKLIATWLIQQAVGIVKSFIAPTTTSPDSLGSSGTPGQLAGGEYSAATGGLVSKSGVRRYADGGVVDGTGGGGVPLSMGKAGVDSVHTLLMPGEVVIRKSAVDYYGADRLLALNDQKIQKFANGGLVGGVDPMGKTTKRGDQILQIVNVADPSQIPQQPVDAQQVINVITLDAAKRGPVYKTIRAVSGS
ncbi:hypothetical protein [Geobacter sp. SVR]|uniref:hypothetical protein n=1 Tax=Geobacter sp. SVR TaxID=2495594 RepID=UPI00143EFE9F|nr:hypothetical protein [Geobacter sp. SVR]BCS54040.1 hypothetical protein GSVR_23480 [Geobacter sp. SVR]GCF86179.1 hypothetical protein GSbR_27790 [Geobacter sp. SVR]